ncbi:MAG: nucleoside phosphorylase [Bacteroidota bacterium]
MYFEASELILNSDGSIYHLHLLPNQIADLIITVGDPDRVDRVSRHFDRIDERVSKREFVTHTGELGGQRISVVSTGIGTDNIDIVLNELDILAKIDLKNRTLLPPDRQRQLSFIRLGTSGCLQSYLPLDSILISAYAIGLDGLMPFYNIELPKESSDLLDNLQAYLAAEGIKLPGSSYAAQADHSLVDLFSQPDNYLGITLTAAGFYGPQARSLRLKSKLDEKTVNSLQHFLYKSALSKHIPPAEVQKNKPPNKVQLQITNLEMETAGIYALAHALGHKAVSISVLLANRANNTFSEQPKKTVDHMIEWALDRLTALPLRTNG